MTSMNRRNFVATLGIAGTALLAGCNGSEEATQTTDDAQTTDDSAEEASYTLVKEGVLTNVAELGFSPFEYIDEDGNTVGFDVDLSNAIAEKMGLTCEWLPNQAFDTLVPTIKQGGKADISIAGVTITDERLEDVDFSDPYLNSNQALIVAASSDYATEDLDAEDIQIACQTGTTGDAWIQENLPNATRVPLADVTAGMMGVSTGSYQAMVIDLPVAQNMLAQSFSDLTILEEIPTGEQYGIAVSYDNPGLKDAINAALAEIESDGTMDELKQKWFGTTDI
ncbi:amino acid ABC transporter substrate-binding protein [Olsenella sp. An285]|uniref:ABC transporter substrate-binding protein n=1 Tax=Olsenella sp. An285 TaxID=1965621 RepID=UPI000B388843|nr:ABC transporter substrate-binding protein [Olsenella sp. An285]OUO47550.1 amino acid ABC transporter substrate-binding protein [Olsenella sp. An285]